MTDAAKDEYHALFSPSSAGMWIACANAIAASAGQPEIGDKKAADLGTDKHELLSLCLTFKVSAEKYLGHVLKRGHKVDQAFSDEVQIVIDGVYERIEAYKTTGATVSLEIEQDVPISQITGEAGATGRADVVLLAEWKDKAEICVIDAKFGYREVLPENNPQLMMYAHGAAEKFNLVADFETAVLVIHQPALSEAPREWAVPVDGICEWVRGIAAPAATHASIILRMSEERALKMEDFSPSDDACRYCRAAGTCPAQLAKVREVAGEDFEIIQAAETPDTSTLSNDRLGEMWPWLDFLEGYAKSVRGRIEHELMQGNPVKGTKLVEGKRGNRTWASDEEAEKLLKSFRLKQEQMYSFKLLGPKPILEALKDQPRRVKKVAELITQKDGKPHVAHISDPRPALKIEPAIEAFEPVESNDDLV